MLSADFDRSRAAWGVVGAALLAALLFVVYSFVGTFVFGLFLYYATRPIYRRLNRHVSPPSLAAAVALFALALPALLVVGYALLIVFQEVDRLTSGTTFDPTDYGVDPEFVERIADPAALLRVDLLDYVSFATVRSITDSLGSAADTLAFVGVGLLHLFVMIAIAFYLLRDGDKLARWALSQFADDRGVLESYAAAVHHDFNSIFFGNILNAILTGTIGVIAYSVLNVFAPPGVRVPAAPLVGLLAGIASLVPVVGMKLVYVPVALFMVAVAMVGAPEALWFVVAFAAVSFVVVDTIPDLVLRPYVSGRSLHVGAVMLAYTFGPLLFGWYGLFLTPMLLVLVVQFGRIVLPQLMRPEPIRPFTVDPSQVLEPPTASELSGDADGRDGREGEEDTHARPPAAETEERRSSDGERDADRRTGTDASE